MENGTMLIWEKLKELVDAEIKQQTAACVRMKTMVVTTAYDETTKTVGVTEAFGEEVQLPVCSDVNGSELAVGESVWVMIPYSMSNAIVMMRGDGSKGTSATAQDIPMSATDSSTVYANLIAKASAYPQTVTLTTAGWAQNGSVYEQTVNVTGMTADTTQSSAVMTATADDAQEKALSSAQVRMSAQGDGTITFRAPALPTAELYCNVLVIATGGDGSAV